MGIYHGTIGWGFIMAPLGGVNQSDERQERGRLRVRRLLSKWQGKFDYMAQEQGGAAEGRL